jgi:pyrroline-5-carboxylate reductase
VITEQRILLIGCGNMGRALVRGWLAQGIAASQICVVDTQDAARAAAAGLGVVVKQALDRDVVADIVVFAVKPQQLDATIGDYRSLISGGGTVLSIAAGKTLAYFESAYGTNTAIVRAMPNTPAAIGRGISALVANAAATAAQRKLAETLLGAVGNVVWLSDETHMDAVTAVSGSGPAYVFLLIEALIAAAERQGLEATLARELATATVAGAGAYAAQSVLGPAELRQQVTSPGGTTQAALDVLMAQHGLKELIDEAVLAATARSRELAQSS